MYVPCSFQMDASNLSSTSASIEEEPEEKRKFAIPSWATRPPEGAHLDKVMIDEKPAYYMGRNPKMVDIGVEHASCSRVHALLLFHGALKRFAIVDLGSSHGTFVGNLQIEPLKVVFVEVGTQFHLGASTRRYTLRDKTDIVGRADDDEEEKRLPLDQELESLTEYNTALNRRIPQLPISVEEARRKKKKRPNVVFIEEEDVINPEDVDPSIGRFRNLVTTAVISTNPAKRTLRDFSQAPKTKRLVRAERSQQQPLSSALGGMPINAAPDLELYEKELPAHHMHTTLYGEVESGPQKKKYVKEAWPGRKPGVL